MNDWVVGYDLLVLRRAGIRVSSGLVLVLHCGVYRCWLNLLLHLAGRVVPF